MGETGETALGIILSARRAAVAQIAEVDDRIISLCRIRQTLVAQIRDFDIVEEYMTRCSSSERSEEAIPPRTDIVIEFGESED